MKNESVETQDKIFTLRVFPGDASTLPPLLDPALQSLASGSPLSRTDLTGGSTLLLPCQTQPRRFRKGPVVKGPVRTDLEIAGDRTMLVAERKNDPVRFGAQRGMERARSRTAGLQESISGAVDVS